jgi:cell wall-associated NlpC family hydrolase
MLRLARLRRPLVVAAVLVGVLTPATAAQAEPSIDQIEQQIETKSTALERVVEQYNKVNEQLKHTQAQVTAVNARLTGLNSALTEANEQIRVLAVQAFKGGDLVAASAVLSSGTPGVMVDRLTTIEQLARNRQRDIDTARSAKVGRDAEATKLTALASTQQKQRDTLAGQKRKITKELDHLEDLKAEIADRSSVSTGGSYSGNPPNVSGKAGVAVRFAYGALGTPYVWAAEGPNGYDCSGLTLAAWRAAGVSLPHNAAMQYDMLPKVSRGDLAPGDLVFYSGLGHVGIYVGSGKVIHAPTFGEVVKISSVDMMTPYGYARPS